MKKKCNFFLVLFSITIGLFAQEKTKKEKALRIVPLITSTPLMGVGFGGAASYLYNTGTDNSSKSQLQVGGQYSNTDSYNVFVTNNAWFNDNKILSTTAFTYSGINNEFTSDGKEVSYNANTVVLVEYLMFKVAKNIYLGSPLKYKNVKYTPNNEAGEEFLYNNGYQDENSLGVGIASSYDSRKNKYYPINSTWATAQINSNPTFLGAPNPYFYLVLDVRHYLRGFHENGVWAFQYFGQYSSDKAPDSGLPTISGKNLLRGFPAGQYKAKYLSGAQTEYRYTFGESRFRATTFFGVANLAGGSFGVDGRSRDDDGWYSAGGLGARYILQPKTGVDLRLDFVRTSKGDNAIYLKLNQAF